MRILFHSLLRLIDIYEAEHFHRSVPGLLLVSVRVQKDRFHELLSDRVSRVQAGHGVLEDDGDLVASDIFHDILTGTDKFLSVQLDGSRNDFTCSRQDLHDRVGRDRLTGAGLSYDSQYFAPLQVEGDAVYGADLSGVREEGSM